MMKKYLENQGDLSTIPLGARHRAWNETDETVQFIEVQTGELILVKSDIVRIEDEYNRK
jgi:mannose-6-phosphate isomerase-like protein (cupin superfamily)